MMLGSSMETEFVESMHVSDSKGEGEEGDLVSEELDPYYNLKDLTQEEFWNLIAYCDQMLPTLWIVPPDETPTSDDSTVLDENLALHAYDMCNQMDLPNLPYLKRGLVKEEKSEGIEREAFAFDGWFSKSKAWLSSNQEISHSTMLCSKRCCRIKEEKSEALDYNAYQNWGLFDEHQLGLTDPNQYLGVLQGVKEEKCEGMEMVLERKAFDDLFSSSNAWQEHSPSTVLCYQKCCRIKQEKSEVC